MTRHRAAVAGAGLVAALAVGLTGCGRTVVAVATATPALSPSGATASPQVEPTSDASPTPELTSGPPATSAPPTDRPDDASPGITVTGSQGTVEVGPGAQLPGDWPAAVPPLPGFTITTSVTSTAGGRKTWTATYEAAGNRLPQVRDYVDALTQDGFTLITEIDGGEGSGSIYALTSPDYEVTVLASLDRGKTSVVQAVTTAS